VLRVALTGGIATGKSYVLTRLAARNVPTIDADVIAHEVVRCGEPAWSAVRDRFGADILLPDGEIDRLKLGSIVFADPKARRDLESIVHPAVYAAIAGWSEGLPAQTRIAVADIPLLYETGHDREFAKVIVTWCSRETQIERMAARGIASQNAANRLAAQWSTNEKARRADFVIRTEGTFKDTDTQIDRVYEQLVRAS
jgi:dephospho-CoA kinase